MGDHRDHSPTEIADEISDDEELPEVKEEKEDLEGEDVRLLSELPGSGSGRKSKNKRGRNDGTSTSPEKKRDAGEPGDLPMTGRELRRLLAGHLQDVKTEVRGAWKEMDERIDTVAKDVGSVAQEVKKEREKTKGVTERVQRLEILGEETRKKVESMEKELVDFKKKGESSHGGGQADPWAQYLRNNKKDDKPGDTPPGPTGREELSEEDRRTMIVGGWAQDTKKGTIIEEAKAFLSRDDVKNLIDQQDLLVWGPRRSFGALKFKPRGDETESSLRDRMWGVIKALRSNPVTLQSSAADNGGVAKNMWVQFVKTKEARKRSQHCSLLRRLCLEVARDVQKSGESCRPEATEEAKYECDWAAGTIWFQDWKIGSASHRAPRGESIKVISSGWVDVQAIANITGVTFTCALQAVEREINKTFASWNVGGQNYEKIEVAVREFDLVAVQEISRTEAVGWDERETKSFMWFAHRDEQQWRGVAVGVAKDLFDCVIDKMATSNGAAWLVRLRGHKRLILASLHCPTGVTVAKYQEVVGTFKQKLKKWHPDCPATVGVDVNEVIQWTSSEDEEPGAFPVRGGGKIEAFLELLGSCRLRACPPEVHARGVPTHFPRDATRVGRHIDVIASRLVRMGEVKIVEAARTWIITDHALLFADIYLFRKWISPRFDTRPRWVHGAEPLPPVNNLEHLYEAAKNRTVAGKVRQYEDDEEVRDAVRQAKASGDKCEWKGVHAIRRRKLRMWKSERFRKIWAGDWSWYRGYKNEKNARGWWGTLLANRSAEDLAADAGKHLEEKMWDDTKPSWDETLETIIAANAKTNDFRPVQAEEVWGALEGMKAQAALGPDGVSVPLLKQLMHEQPEQLCRLVDETILHPSLPDEWHKSFLALLAKVSTPTGVGQLRPIAMSCTLQKMITRVVMNRCFDSIRSTCRWASSGKGRQVADLIGAVSRFRDHCREWRLHGILLKLDIRGAFDYIHRSSVADFLVTRLGNSPHGAELAFLLRLLSTNRLIGQAPGGAEVEVKANRGIRQGSPESAELFGLIIQQVMVEAHEDPRWRKCSGELDDLPLDGGCFQDDVVMWGDEIHVMENNVKIIVELLAKLGLRLAAEKTGIIVTPYYRGPRSMQIDDKPVAFLEQGESIRILGLDFCFEDGQSQQAKCLMGRFGRPGANMLNSLKDQGAITTKSRPSVLSCRVHGNG
ncbi:unnamed protein product [Symbiodinium sp. CCMP2592]|nr:unnamed protein product [Symbiodinium sp. CCMP2592]